AASAYCGYFFLSSRRRHTRWPRDWSSDVCSSDLEQVLRALCYAALAAAAGLVGAADRWAVLGGSPLVPAAFFAALGTALLAAVEIGRASCRERGEMWGGCGSVGSGI